jgi:hypothetical protein
LLTQKFLQELIRRHGQADSPEVASALERALETRA